MKHNSSNTRARRDFLGTSGALVVSLAAIGPGRSLAAESPKPAEKGQPPADAAPEVSTLEDLMREHGVLRRILLIYEEAAARLDKEKECPAETLTQATGIVRRFVEDYHEKLEEDFIFPRFEKAGKLVDLTKVLRSQHDAGRRLTDRIRSLAGAAMAKNRPQQESLARNLRLFIRMYRPHASREDTILFPAFHSIITAAEYDALGDKFEDRETELFGKEGFEKIVAEIAGMEKALAIFELADFTPKI